MREMSGDMTKKFKVKNFRNVSGDRAKFSKFKKFKKGVRLNVLNKHVVTGRIDQIAFDNRKQTN